MLKESKIYVLVCDRCEIEYPNIQYFNKDVFTDVENYIDYIEEVSSEDLSVEDFIANETFDVKEYVNDEYDPEGFHLSDEGDEERKERPIVESHSFHEELQDQFNSIAESEKELAHIV